MIDDLDIRGTCWSPSEAHTPLIVDAHAHLALSTALQRLEPIARRHLQIIESTGNLQLSELASRDRLDRREPAHALPRSQTLGLLVGERHDHSAIVTHRVTTSNHT